MRAAYLLGFRGAGKTTLGRRLAGVLGWDFLDLDEEWERRRGRTILEFVESQGIAAFRREEELLLAEAERSPNPAGGAGRLVATGGGVVDWRPPSREILRASPHPKIWLKADGETLWRRLEAKPERRKIGELSSITALQALLQKREPFYAEIATYTVENQDITQAFIELKRLVPG
jgi:shikimate kinase